MKKLISFAFILFAFGCSSENDAKYSDLIIETHSGSVTYKVETATTPEELQKGLMYRKSMPENHGMIFNVNPPRPIVMWMKNTYISLDMIFVGTDGTINQVIKNTTPESEQILGEDVKSRAVIELNAGQADKHNIHVGDIVRHQILDNIQ